ncbi:hypothetical protein [Psychromicrobium sp. YIM B11713]|uniref:hypothetical protein n=1 Tax=Psychromicrobium sp. YIM B11713 TaxID=3145233 RepID=UPI00374F2ECF
MATDATNIAPVKNNETVRSWSIFGATLLTTVFGIFAPIVFVAAIILAVVATLNIKKATTSLTRGLLIASVAVAGVGLLFMGAVSISLAMA